MIKKIVMISTLVLSLGLAPQVYAKPKEKIKTIHTCVNTDTTENVLACSVYHEARGEGIEGMMLVASVIMNRKNSEEYPSKIRKVVYQKHQFSYTRQGKLKVYDEKSWQNAKTVAKVMILLDKNKYLKTLFTDPSKGSIFFFKKGKEPRWTKKLHKTRTYKSHVFYREKKDDL